MALLNQNLIDKIQSLTPTEIFNLYSKIEAVQQHPWAKCAVFSRLLNVRTKHVMVSFDEENGAVTRVDGTDHVPSKTVAKTYNLTLDNFDTNSEISREELECSDLQSIFIAGSGMPYGSHGVESNPYIRKAQDRLLRLFDFNFEKFIKDTIGHNSYIDTYHDLYVAPTDTVDGVAAGDATYFSPSHLARACSKLRHLGIGKRSYLKKPLVWFVPDILTEVLATKAWKDAYSFEKTGISITGFFNEQITPSLLCGGQEFFIIQIPIDMFDRFNFNTPDENPYAPNHEYDGVVDLGADGVKYASWLTTMDALLFCLGAWEAPEIPEYRRVGTPGGYTIGETVSRPGNALNSMKNIVIANDELFGCMPVFPRRIVRLDMKLKAKI